MTKMVFVFSFPSLRRGCLSSFILTFRKKESAASIWGLLPSTEVDGAACVCSRWEPRQPHGEGEGQWELLAPYQSTPSPRLETCGPVMQRRQNCREVWNESLISAPVFNPTMALVPEPFRLRFSYGRY